MNRHPRQTIPSQPMMLLNSKYERLNLWLDHAGFQEGVVLCTALVQKKTLIHMTSVPAAHLMLQRHFLHKPLPHRASNAVGLMVPPLCMIIILASTSTAGVPLQITGS